MRLIWTRFLSDLYARFGAPLTFRLILQPLMAIIIGVRAGYRDGELARPPYIWSLVRHGNLRTDLLREGWRDIFRVLLLAVTVDIIYQLFVEGWIFPLEAITLAITVAIIPYLATRTVVNPASRFMKPRQ